MVQRKSMAIQMRIAGVVLCKDPQYPIFKYTLESLKYFDDIVVITEKDDVISRLRYKASYLSDCEYQFHLDEDEVIHPDVYFELKRIWERHSRAIIVCPRVHIKKGKLVYSAKWRINDPQARGIPRFTVWKFPIHHVPLGKQYIQIKYPIVHYGNCIETWNIDNLCKTHMRWKSLNAESLFDRYKVSNCKELIKKLNNDKEISIYSLYDQSVLPNLEVIKCLK